MIKTDKHDAEIDKHNAKFDKQDAEIKELRNINDE